MSEIRVVYKRPGFPAEVLMIDNGLDSFNKLLDGGYLCGIRLSPTVHGYVDDEGLLKELPLNFYLNGEAIVGPAVFSEADAEGEDIGFVDPEKALALAKFLNDGEGPLNLRTTR